MDNPKVRERCAMSEVVPPPGMGFPVLSKFLEGLPLLRDMVWFLGGGDGEGCFVKICCG